MRGREKGRGERGERKGRWRKSSKTLNPSRRGRNGGLGPGVTPRFGVCVCVFEQIPSK